MRHYCSKFQHHMSGIIRHYRLSKYHQGMCCSWQLLMASSSQLCMIRILLMILLLKLVMLFQHYNLYMHLLPINCKNPLCKQYMSLIPI